MSGGQQQQQQEQQKEVFHAQILYREWGRRFTVLQQYLKGIHYYEKSTEHGDENFLWTLLGLSVALKKSGQFKEAAEIAEKCMKMDPAHLGANWTRMEALFDVAEFCGSLVYAHRGLKHRQHFRQAVLVAEETVEDCVGANLPSTMLRQLQPWIGKLEGHRSEMLQRMNEEEDEFEGIGEEQSRFKVDDPAARLHNQRRRMDRLMAAIYIGSSCHDKCFLDNLLRHPALPSANKTGSEKLSATTTDCLGRLQAQQESLRTRRPLYAVRARAKATLSAGYKVALWQEMELRRCLVRNEAMFVLRQLHEARLRRDYPMFFRMVERIKEKFESYSPRVFPERPRYLDALYRMVARAYIDPRNLLRFRPEDEDRRILQLRRLVGLKGPKLPRDEELAWRPTLDVKRALRTCRERLALSTRPLEILWIFHELCKLFLEIRRYDMARFYAKKTRDLSLGAGHDDWAVNASHILLRIELAQHNRNEAKEAATVALESARKLKVHFLVDFYERVIAYVDTLDFGRLGEKDGIVTRQRVISGLMTEDMKPVMNLLLRAMEAVPARRRLSVMPGCKAKDKKPMASKRQTVAPAPPKDFQKEIRDALLKKYAPSKRVLGWIDFDKYD